MTNKLTLAQEIEEFRKRIGSANELRGLRIINRLKEVEKVYDQAAIDFYNAEGDSEETKKIFKQMQKDVGELYGD